MNNLFFYRLHSPINEMSKKKIIILNNNNIKILTINVKQAKTKNMICTIRIFYSRDSYKANPNNAIPINKNPK